ncbi:MAG TPA: protein-L-isoaspartate(D-aspartate) O-methyltransferase [Candidatus Aminicenantes bacterium]|nr:protein-L-isoaspartate(D-aspartate) O-methyltransferase [Candidatus Aminicenantes bacterium]
MKRVLPLISCLLLLLPPPLAAAQDDAAFAAAREKMVREQILERGITDARILGAFRKVPRHLFVAPRYRGQAYGDFPLPIAEGQTISQPYIVAIMTAVIAPTASKKVLEIGTGSGYQAAVMAELAREVYTIEIFPTLADASRRLLEGLRYRNIRFRTGNGYVGWPEAAPFDGIIVTCAPDHIPAPLLEQLAVGGRLVIPIRYSDTVQDLLLVEKLPNGRLKKTNLIPVLFVPMIRANAR